jgi:glycosyltransferase involved in cell wall biosynthesis
LNPERDFENVLRAAARLKGRLPLRWRIIGRGDPGYVASLHRFALTSGVADDVSIEPEVTAADVPALIGRTAVGLVTYKRNPITEIATPNKAYEYAFAGKAMVVAGLRGLHSLLGDTVLYYPPGDPAALADRIEALLVDAPLRRRLESAVRGRIYDHRWDVMEDRLVRLYDRLLNRSSSPLSSFASSPSDDGRRGRDAR